MLVASYILLGNGQSLQLKEEASRKVLFSIRERVSFSDDIVLTRLLSTPKSINKSPEQCGECIQTDVAPA